MAFQLFANGKDLEMNVGDESLRGFYFANLLWILELFDFIWSVDVIGEELEELKKQ